MLFSLSSCYQDEVPHSISTCTGCLSITYSITYSISEKTNSSNCLLFKYAVAAVCRFTAELLFTNTSSPCEVDLRSARRLGRQPSIKPASGQRLVFWRDGWPYSKKALLSVHHWQCLSGHDTAPREVTVSGNAFKYILVNTAPMLV